MDAVINRLKARYQKDELIKDLIINKPGPVLSEYTDPKLAEISRILLTHPNHSEQLAGAITSSMGIHQLFGGVVAQGDGQTLINSNPNIQTKFSIRLSNGGSCYRGAFAVLREVGIELLVDNKHFNGITKGYLEITDKDLLEHFKFSAEKVEDTQKRVATYYGISTEDLVSRKYAYVPGPKSKPQSRNRTDATGSPIRLVRPGRSESGSNVFAAYARKYWERGLSVIPVDGKDAFKTGWTRFSLSLPSEAELTRWERAHPSCNVGLVLGPASGLCCVDIDTDDPVQLLAIHSVLPPSPVRKRGQKGESLFYKFTGHSTKRFKLHPKASPVVELLSSGTQTVMPPSIHPDTNQPYVYLTEENLETCSPNNLPELPADIVSQLERVLQPFKKDKYDPQQETGGRNQTLKSQTVAAIHAGKSDQQIAKEILRYDSAHHIPPLFSDDSEKQMQSRDAETNALRFVQSIRRSISTDPPAEAIGL